MTRRVVLAIAVCTLLVVCGISRAGDFPGGPRSHDAPRAFPEPTNRPRSNGPERFVDPENHRTKQDGTINHPWKTIQQAMEHLQPGDTLYLRDGVYSVPIVISLAGRQDAPITIRPFPGERVILDGSWPEFQVDPENSWEPFPDGAADEYRSTRRYPNAFQVLGAFGDSMIGLQTYHDPADLRASNELWVAEGEEVAPVYCGPGLWYDRQSGHIHIRLAHTQLESIGKRNYRGTTDPRDVPLVLAPFHSQPLVIDGAEHVRIQDLVVRGAGWDSVSIRRSKDIEIDGVTVYCGTHGLRVETTGPLRMKNCAFRGLTPPWAFRSELKHSYLGENNSRDIVRLTGMILLLAEEGKLFRFPQNHDWEISHCEFTDGHDGPYLGGVAGVRFHHNLLDNLHDDGIYLSAWGAPGGDVRIFQNRLSRCLTTFAFGELDGTNRLRAGSGVWIYRNEIDLTGPVHYGRPTPQNPAGTLDVSRLCGDHGSPIWEPIWFYQNTVRGQSPESAFGMAGHVRGTKRRVFNNLFVSTSKLPVATPPPSEDLEQGGNLHWLADDGAPPFRDAGVRLPADWPDPLREGDDVKPDVGALPRGGEPFRVGLEEVPN